MGISEKERLRRKDIAREMYKRKPSLLDTLVEEGTITETSANIVKAVAGEGKTLVDAVREFKPDVKQVQGSEFYTPFSKFVEALVHEPAAKKRIPRKYKGIKGLKRAKKDFEGVDIRHSTLARSHDWETIFMTTCLGLSHAMNIKKKDHALFKQYASARDYGRVSLRTFRKRHNTLYAKINRSKKLGIAHASYLLKLLKDYLDTGMMSHEEIARVHDNSDKLLEKYYGGDYANLVKEWDPVFEQIFKSVQPVERESSATRYHIQEFEKVCIKKVKIVKTVPEYVPGENREFGIDMEKQADKDPDLGPTFAINLLPPSFVTELKEKPNIWVQLGSALYCCEKEDETERIVRASNIRDQIERIFAKSYSLNMYLQELKKSVSKNVVTEDIMPKWKKILGGMYSLPYGEGWMLDLTPSTNGSLACNVTLFKQADEGRRLLGCHRSTFYRILDIGYIEYEKG